MEDVDTLLEKLKTDYDNEKSSDRCSANALLAHVDAPCQVLTVFRPMCTDRLLAVASGGGKERCE